MKPFEKSLKEVLPREPVLAIRCGGHEPYRRRRVARITQALRTSGAEYLVTTSKDWVKLGPLWPRELPVLVAELTIRWGRDQALGELVAERLSDLVTDG